MSKLKKPVTPEITAVWDRVRKEILQDIAVQKARVLQQETDAGFIECFENQFEEHLLEAMNNMWMADRPITLKRHETWGQIGLDSLDMAELIMWAEERYGIEIPDDDAERLTTFGSAVDYLQNKVGYA